jgi:hypothetical protein
MEKKKQPPKPIEIPKPGKSPEIIPPIDPEEPLVQPETDPDIIPDEIPFEIPPFELPAPAEGP